MIKSMVPAQSLTGRTGIRPVCWSHRNVHSQNLDVHELDHVQRRLKQRHVQM